MKSPPRKKSFAKRISGRGVRRPGDAEWVEWTPPPSAANDTGRRLTKEIRGARFIRRGLTVALLAIGVTTLGSVIWSLHDISAYRKAGETVEGAQEVLASTRLLYPSDAATIPAGHDAASDVGVLMKNAGLPAGWTFSRGRLIDPLGGDVSVVFGAPHTPRQLIITLGGTPNSVCADLASGLAATPAMLASTLRIGGQGVSPGRPQAVDHPVAVGSQRWMARAADLCRVQEAGALDTISISGNL